MCAQAITKISGASFATLLATALLSVAKATKGRKEVPWSDIPELLRGAEEAMIARGKAALGEKTIIDTVRAFRLSVQGLDDPKRILDTGTPAVHETIEHFRDQPIKAGRARIWSEKSAGLDDPGMVVFMFMLESLKIEQET